jgi:signal transduction histidine kinase
MFAPSSQRERAMSSRMPQLPGAFPGAMVIVDATGKILQASAPALSLFGFREGQLTGTPIQALFPGQPAPFPGRRSRRDQAGYCLDLVGSRGDSSRFRAAVTVMPMRGEHGVAAVITIRELTNERQAQSVLEPGLEMLLWEAQDRRAMLCRLIWDKEREWARIAAGIHDDTIRATAAASLRLQQLRIRLRDRVALQTLDEVEEALSVSLHRLRLLIFDFRPPGLEHGSLGAALRVSLEQMHADTGIAYRLDDKGSALVSSSTALLIYRTVREALVNVRKHARASTVAVELLEVEGGCLIRVVDDGVGYDPADVEGRACHLGLVLMRERAVLAGGWCRLESSPGAGTTVEFWVPLGESFAVPAAGHDGAGRPSSHKRAVKGVHETGVTAPAAGCIATGRIEDGQSPG